MNGIEIINPQLKKARITHALFDFDGTVSLIRQGWQKIMIDMMVDILLKTPNHEPRKETEMIVREFVAALTGKQTIYQMFQLVYEVEKRGGKPLTAQEYKHQYLSLLGKHIAGRISDLRSGKVLPNIYTVKGATVFLQLLREKGIVCYLASGTDERFVLEEAELLGVRNYFDFIWGAQDDYMKFSKRIVIEKILSKNGIQKNNLVIFGDGNVEVLEASRLGCLAVGVASNELTQVGVDEWKRSRLIQAGANIVVPDFDEAETLLALIL